MKLKTLPLFVFFAAAVPSPQPSLEIQIPAAGKTCCELAHGLKAGPSHTARGTGYYPDSSALEGGFHTRYGDPLSTLQGFLSGKHNHVSLAMDKNLGRVKRKVCISELNVKYGKQIPFVVEDTGGAFTGKSWSRVDIATKDRKASLDPTINGKLTITECK